MRIRTLHAILAAALLCGSSCGHHGDESAASSDADPVLVEVGDTLLRLHDVESRIPAGLTPADSAELFGKIVDSWVERMILERLGSDDPEELERIERLTADYRQRLLVESYRRRARLQARSEVSAATVRKHYDAHRGDFLAERPLIKGVYIKIPSGSASLLQVRRWMFGSEVPSIDMIERLGLSDVQQYSSFTGKWVDFQTIASRIPVRFGDADRFVATHDRYETRVGGSVYLLRITDFLPSGSQMPFEFASEIIRESLGARDAAGHEERLMRRLKEDAVSDGLLRPGIIDPLNTKRPPTAADNQNKAK